MTRQAEDGRPRFLLFDLDETLYPRNTRMFEEIGQRINAYMERIGFDPEQVPQLRRHYFMRYGTTLRGLQLHHQVDTDDYLIFVHDFDVGRYIQPNAALERVLHELPQVKAIFTNATSEYAWRILTALGVEKHFEHILDIHAFDYHSKPDRYAFQVALETLQARAPECLLIEDNLRNIQMGKKLGMHTVLVSPDGEPQEDADFVVSDVIQIEQVMREMQ
ncbi:MAG: pyrimidine 5'-nucleotidase [Chloroflexia bacterium]|nr:pyrimidine 5'-nucleotidase [Chloroflexia bacterium]